MSDFEDDVPEGIDVQDGYNDRQRAGRGRADEGGAVQHRNRKEKEIADRIKIYSSDQEKFVELINIAYEELIENDINIITESDINSIKDNLSGIVSINLKNPMGVILGYKGRSLDKKTIDDLIKKTSEVDLFKNEYGVGPIDIVRYAVLWNNM
jgi:hypothetical protein